MNKNLLVSKLDKAVPGAVLETRRFGRTGMLSIWVEAAALQKVSRKLLEDPELRLDWLENLSAVEFEKVFVVTYFLRSFTQTHHFVMRASVVPPAPQAEVIFPSISSIWPMGKPMEQEVAELFGICFTENSKNKSEPLGRTNLLPESWGVGFPLRKSFCIPGDVNPPQPTPSSNFTNLESPKKPE